MIALSSEHFITDTPEHKVNRYRKDLKRFQNLKAAVKLRCDDDLDTRDLEPKIRKLLDTHLSASEVTTLTGPVNIFDDNAFNQALDRQPTLSAKADTIRNNTQRVITAKYDEDPAFYQKLSEMLQAAIDAFREKRISELEYLQQTEKVRNDIVYRRNDDAPTELNGDEDAIALFGVISNILTDHISDPAQTKQVNIDAAQKTLGIIRSNVVRDWYRTDDHPNQKFMANEIDDYIYDVLEEKHEVELDEATKDRMINDIINLAKNRSTLRD